MSCSMECWSSTVLCGLYSHGFCEQRVVFYGVLKQQSVKRVVFIHMAFVNIVSCSMECWSSTVLCGLYSHGFCEQRVVFYGVLKQHSVKRVVFIHMAFVNIVSCSMECWSSTVLCGLCSHGFCEHSIVFYGVLKEHSVVWFVFIWLLWTECRVLWSVEEAHCVVSIHMAFVNIRVVSCSMECWSSTVLCGLCSHGFCEHSIVFYGVLKQHSVVWFAFTWFWWT
jgi:16S rRNA C1402 (ribose-2'-O) methylase RsmI